MEVSDSGIESGLEGTTHLGSIGEAALNTIAPSHKVCHRCHSNSVFDGFATLTIVNTYPSYIY